MSKNLLEKFSSGHSIFDASLIWAKHELFEMSSFGENSREQFLPSVRGINREARYNRNRNRTAISFQPLIFGINIHAPGITRGANFRANCSTASYACTKTAARMKSSGNRQAALIPLWHAIAETYQRESIVPSIGESPSLNKAFFAPKIARERVFSRPALGIVVGFVKIYRSVERSIFFCPVFLFFPPFLFAKRWTRNKTAFDPWWNNAVLFRFIFERAVYDVCNPEKNLFHHSWGILLGSRALFFSIIFESGFIGFHSGENTVASAGVDLLIGENLRGLVASTSDGVVSVKFEADVY